MYKKLKKQILMLNLTNIYSMEKLSNISMEDTTANSIESQNNIGIIISTNKDQKEVEKDIEEIQNKISEYIKNTDISSMFLSKEEIDEVVKIIPNELKNQVLKIISELENIDEKYNKLSNESSDNNSVSSINSIYDYNNYVKNLNDLSIMNKIQDVIYYHFVFSKIHKFLSDLTNNVTQNNRIISEKKIELIEMKKKIELLENDLKELKELYKIKPNNFKKKLYYFVKDYLNDDIKDNVEKSAFNIIYKIYLAFLEKNNIKSDDSNNVIDINQYNSYFNDKKLNLSSHSNNFINSLCYEKFTKLSNNLEEQDVLKKNYNDLKEYIKNLRPLTIDKNELKKINYKSIFQNNLKFNIIDNILKSNKNDALKSINHFFYSLENNFTNERKLLVKSFDAFNLNIIEKFNKKYNISNTGVLYTNFADSLTFFVNKNIKILSNIYEDFYIGYLTFNNDNRFFLMLNNKDSNINLTYKIESDSLKIRLNDEAVFADKIKYKHYPILKSFVIARKKNKYSICFKDILKTYYFGENENFSDFFNNKLDYIEKQKKNLNDNIIKSFNLTKEQITSLPKNYYITYQDYENLNKGTGVFKLINEMSNNELGEMIEDFMGYYMYNKPFKNQEKANKFINCEDECNEKIFSQSKFNKYLKNMFSFNKGNGIFSFNRFDNKINITFSDNKITGFYFKNGLLELNYDKSKFLKDTYFLNYDTYLLSIKSNSFLYHIYDNIDNFGIFDNLVNVYLDLNIFKDRIINDEKLKEFEAGNIVKNIKDYFENLIFKNGSNKCLFYEQENFNKITNSNYLQLSNYSQNSFKYVEKLDENAINKLFFLIFFDSLKFYKNENVIRKMIILLKNRNYCQQVLYFFKKVYSILNNNNDNIIITENNVFRDKFGYISEEERIKMERVLQYLNNSNKNINTYKKSTINKPRNLKDFSFSLNINGIKIDFKHEFEVLDDKNYKNSPFDEYKLSSELYFIENKRNIVINYNLVNGLENFTKFDDYYKNLTKNDKEEFKKLIFQLIFKKDLSNGLIKNCKKLTNNFKDVFHIYLNNKKDRIFFKFDNNGNIIIHGYIAHNK